MNTNTELTKDDLAIDNDIQIDDDNQNEILVCIETWFDVEKKFNVSLNEGELLYMYGCYNPFCNSLKITCAIESDINTPTRYFSFEPSENESKLIKEMIAEKINQEYGQTPQEFCMESWDEPLSMGEII